MNFENKFQKDKAVPKWLNCMLEKSAILFKVIQHNPVPQDVKFTISSIQSKLPGVLLSQGCH